MLSNVSHVSFVTWQLYTFYSKFTASVSHSMQTAEMSPRLLPHVNELCSRPHRGAISQLLGVKSGLSVRLAYVFIYSGATISLVFAGNRLLQTLGWLGQKFPPIKP